MAYRRPMRTRGQFRRSSLCPKGPRACSWGSPMAAIWRTVLRAAMTTTPVNLRQVLCCTHSPTSRLASSSQACSTASVIMVDPRVAPYERRMGVPLLHVDDLVFKIGGRCLEVVLDFRTLPTRGIRLTRYHG